MARGSDSGPAVGAAKEALACAYLQAQGLLLAARNYRCRQGEIDLVMRHGACLVFVEVRYRQGSAYGSSLESITTRKRLRLVRAAQHYLQRHPTHLDCRFDVLAISGTDHIEWVQDAFQAS